MLNKIIIILFIILIGCNNIKYDEKKYYDSLPDTLKYYTFKVCYGSLEDKMRMEFPCEFFKYYRYEAKLMGIYNGCITYQVTFIKKQNKE